MPSDSYTLIISDAGVSTPATDSVTNASVAAGAAIAFSKLAALTSGNILVGNSSNVPTSVSLSGNVTISNTGVTTIANGAVSSSKLASGLTLGGTTTGTFSGNVTGNVSGSSASFTGALVGDVTGVQGATTIASQAVTFGKMQDVSQYTIFGKPTAGSGSATAISSTSFMLEAGTGFLRQANASDARSTLGLGALATQTNSPTLVAPILGTPAAGSILTNCTGLPISTGVSGLGTGVATFLATPSSANLATAVTGETGSGALVFATSPTLVTPILGTPTSGTLTSCTGLPLTTGVTGTLPIANGGTGPSAYGQTGSQTAGTSTTYTTTYAKLDLTTSLDAAAQFDDNGGEDNRLRYTGSATRRFLIFASMDMLSSNNGAQFSIKIAKNNTVIDATQCNASVSIKSSGTGIAKLVSNWIIELAQNNYVEIFVASVGSNEIGTPQRMRLVATPVF